MRSGKKEDSQKRWRQSLWHFYRRNRRTLCMQASLWASSPGGAGMREGKGEDLIGQILTTQRQRSHKGVLGVEFKFMRRQCKLSFPFFLPIPHPHSPGRACSQAICRSKNALRGKYRHRTLDAFLLAKGKEREGFIKKKWCGRVLGLSTLYYYKSYKKILIVFFFLLYGLMPACRLGMHALQEKNKRHKPGFGHVL